jgi:hypothetical protein
VYCGVWAVPLVMAWLTGNCGSLLLSSIIRENLNIVSAQEKTQIQSTDFTECALLSSNSYKAKNQKFQYHKSKNSPKDCKRKQL